MLKISLAGLIFPCSILPGKGDDLVGLEKHRVGQQFGLRDLGILDGPPLRGTDIVVATAASLLDVDAVNVMIFDDTSASIETSASSEISFRSLSFPTAESICSLVRSQNETIEITNAKLEMPKAQELIGNGVAAIIACPIYGPDTEAIGVFAAFKTNAHVWSLPEKKLAEDMAYLVSQEVILRASFETLRIMASERSIFEV